MRGGCAVVLRNSEERIDWGKLAAGQTFLRGRSSRGHALSDEKALRVFSCLSVRCRGWSHFFPIAVRDECVPKVGVFALGQTECGVPV